MRVNAWSLTDLGCARENNEDSFLVDSERGVFVIADGVGGSSGGEIASQRLVEYVEESAADLAEIVAAGNPIFDRDHRERVFNALLHRIHEANALIYEEGKEVDPMRPPATTCDVVVLSDQAAFIAHVGDSRVYLLRGPEIFRITEDHTFAEQLRQEEIGDVDMLERYRNVLTRSVGGRPQVDVDALFIDLQAGDHLLMCSDGLTDYLSGAELLDFARRAHGPELLDELVSEAKERGGRDNITVLLVEVESVGDDTLKDTATFDTLKQVDILGNIELFKNLGVRDLLKIMRIIYEVSYTDGDIVEQPIGEERCMFIVAEGAVDLLVDDTVIAHLEKGQHFGEFALVSDERQTRARCDGETLLLAVPARRFRSIVSEDPAVGNVLLWNLLEAATRQIRRMGDEMANGG
jgi:serine/threonine protein phosphatase PrpC